MTVLFSLGVNKTYKSYIEQFLYISLYLALRSFYNYDIYIFVSDFISIVTLVKL